MDSPSPRLFKFRVFSSSSSFEFEFGELGGADLAFEFELAALAELELELFSRLRPCCSKAQPRRPSAASRTTREDFQMAVGFLFLVLHKESETFLKFSFWITRNKRALLPILVAGT